MNSQLIVLVLELLFVAVTIPLLHSLKPRLGLAPLFIFVGSNQYLQGVLAATLFVPALGMAVSPGSVVLFSSSIYAILLVYLKEDPAEARSLVLGIVLSNLSLTVLSGFSSWQLQGRGARNILELPLELFELNPRLFVVGTIVLILDAMLIAGVHEFLLVEFRRLPLAWRVLLTLLIVQYADAIFFTSAAFFEVPNFEEILRSQLVGKTLSSLVYAASLFAYLRISRPKLPAPPQRLDLTGPVPQLGAPHFPFEPSTSVDPSAEITQAAAIRIATSPDTPEAILSIMRLTAKSFSWQHAEAWVLDEAADRLSMLGAWSAQEERRIDAFVRHARESGLAIGEDVPGHAWTLPATFWVRDYAGGGFPRSELALTAGFRSAFALPVDVGGARFAVLAFFSTTTRIESRQNSNLALSVASLLGQSIQRRLAMEDLARSEARFRGLFENSRLGIVTMNEDDRVEAANPAALALFRCASDALAGRRFSSLVSDSNSTSGSFAGAAFVGRRFDGSSFPAEVYKFRFETPSGDRIAAQIEDISERLEADTVKKQFVATVSHELRTPLSAITGSLQLAASGALGPCPEPVAEMVGLALRNSDRLLILINDILDFEKLDSGKMDATFMDSRSVALCDLAIDAVSVLASAAGVRLDKAVEDFEIPLDFHRIGQVIVNLLSNAIKFSPAGGRVCLAVARGDDGLACFEVTDEGRGIPPGKVNVLFRPFSQLEPTDSTEKGGTGLGLAISKKIVELHGGAIGVDTTRERGSRFWFTLPLSR